MKPLPPWALVTQTQSHFSLVTLLLIWSSDLRCCLAAWDIIFCCGDFGGYEAVRVVGQCGRSWLSKWTFYWILFDLYKMVSDPAAPLSLLPAPSPGMYTHRHQMGLEPLPLRAAFNRIVHQKAPLEMSAPASLNILCTSLPHISLHACGQCVADCTLRAALCHAKCIHCGLLGVLFIFIEIYTLLHSCFQTHLLWWVISLVQKKTES